MVIPLRDFEIFPFDAHPLDSSSITLERDSSWAHCGPLLDVASMPESYHAWQKAAVHGDLLPRLTPFLSFVHSFLSEAEIYHYWLTIKTSRSTPEFDVPRWHMDRSFLERNDEEEERIKGHWKLSTTLLGPGTLFIVDGARGRVILEEARRSVGKTMSARHECKTIRCSRCDVLQDKVRRHLVTALKHERVVQTAPGECSFFRLGLENGAVHSEPESHGDRIFVNVVPGNEMELRQVTRRWGMHFPRSWSIGVPVSYQGWA